MASQPVKVGPRCPEDTPFKQQRLPAWQPILTPNWVIGTFLIVGCIFMPIGGAIYAASASVTEIRSNYGADASCKTADQFGTKYTAQIVVPQDLSNPLIYYELTNFYQNHRRYVTSRSDGQLRASPETVLSNPGDFVKTVQSQQIQICTPLICGGNAGDGGCGTTTDTTKANGRNNLIYYPCGLIARSMFNDTFDNMRIDGSAPVTLTKTGIAWPSDINKKFLSPNTVTVSGSNFVSTYCGAFGDPCTAQDAAHPDPNIAAQACNISGWCNTPIDPNNPTGPKYTVDLLRQIACGSGGCNCPPATGPVSPVPTAQQIYNCWHSPTDEALIVWMRTAALPTFRKLYARINGVLPKGTYKIDVMCRFPVDVFGGTKSIVISTTSWIGGKNDFLAGSYLAVGAVCIALALVFLAKHVMSPRALSSPENLEFVKG